MLPNSAPDSLTPKNLNFCVPPDVEVVVVEAEVVVVVLDDLEVVVVVVVDPLFYSLVYQPGIRVVTYVPGKHCESE